MLIIANSNKQMNAASEHSKGKSVSSQARFPQNRCCWMLVLECGTNNQQVWKNKEKTHFFILYMYACVGSNQITSQNVLLSAPMSAACFSFVILLSECALSFIHDMISFAFSSFFLINIFFFFCCHNFFALHTLCMLIFFISQSRVADEGQIYRLLSEKKKFDCQLSNRKSDKPNHGNPRTLSVLKI